MRNERLRLNGLSSGLHQPRSDRFKTRRDLRARIAARKREQQRRNLANRESTVAPVLHQGLNVKGVHIMSPLTPPGDHAVLLDRAKQRECGTIRDPHRIGDLTQRGTRVLDDVNEYKRVVAQETPRSRQILTFGVLTAG